MSCFPKRPALSAFALAGVLIPSLAVAQPNANGLPWTLGIGVATTQRPYIGDSNKTIPFPLVTYENDYVRIAGLGGDVKLGSTGPLTFTLRVDYALADGYKSGDAPILNGMEDRKGSLWLGPAVQWNAAWARISLEVLGDALGKSDGIEARLRAEHDFRAGSFMFTPRLAAEWVDRKYVDYYFGVSAAEATPDRPAYQGQATINFEGGVRAAFAMTPTSSIFADVGTRLLGKGITDSPLVGRKETSSLALGYSHRF